MSFAEDIAKFAAKCNGNADLVVRKVVLDIGRSLVEKTPVGNPDLWQNPDNKPEGYVGGMQGQMESFCRRSCCPGV